MRWFQSCFRQGFQNLGGEHLRRFDARKLAASWKERGAEVVYLDVIHQMNTTYPTALSVMAPEAEGRDLIRAFADGCLAVGIRPAAYVTPMEHTAFTHDHPEWCQTKTDGTHFEAPGWSDSPYIWACWNSPYWDRMCALVAEAFARYPLEAAFFDGLLSRHGVCHCPSCAAKFPADTGFALPNTHDPAEPAFRAYRQWKGKTLCAAARRLIAATRVRNPDVEVVSNTPAAWCNWCATQPPEFFDATENVCVESFPGINSPLTPGAIHTSDIAAMAYCLAYTRSQARGFPRVMAYSWTGVMNFSIEESLNLETKAAIAMGGLKCPQGYYPGMKKTYDYVRACEPYLVGSKPVLWAGLAASQESGDTQFWDEGCSGNFFEDLRGMYTAMLESHLPVELVSGRAIGDEPLSPYAVLVLSDVGYMTEAQVRAVRGFVKAGGGLVATGRTSLIGIDGKPMQDFALADVLGVHVAKMPDWPTIGCQFQNAQAALEFDGEPWWKDAAEPRVTPECGWVWMTNESWSASNRGHVVITPWQAVKADRGAKVRAWMRRLHGSHATAAEAAAATGRRPGLVEHRYGRGKVVYLAHRLGETYARLPEELWRRLLKEAIRRVSPRKPVVELKGAPLCVSQHAWEQAEHKRWIIHLVNDLDESGRSRNRLPGEHDQGKDRIPGCVPRSRTVPIHDIEVYIRKPGATQAALPLEGRELKVRKLKDGLRVKLRRLDQHAMIVVT